jgi:hypothetical protein
MSTATGLEQVKRVTNELLGAVPVELLEGREHTIPADRVELIAERHEPGGSVISLDPNLLTTLFREGLELGFANSESDQYALDRWLAPRLHHALRVSRRVASDRNFWAWIAMRFGSKYVFSRFSDGEGRVSAWRFTGDLLRNGVSRLWWAAEMLRNGPDYAAVDLGLRRVVTAQYALELKYSWFRPAAIAFTRVTERGPTPLSSDMMTQLSKRANTYLPIMPLEALGYYDEGDGFDSAWWTGSISREELLSEELSAGPTDGVVAPEALKALEAWFSDVVDELRRAEEVRRESVSSAAGDVPVTAQADTSSEGEAK